MGKRRKQEKARTTTELTMLEELLQKKKKTLARVKSLYQKLQSTGDLANEAEVYAQLHRSQDFLEFINAAILEQLLREREHPARFQLLTLLQREARYQVAVEAVADDWYEVSRALRDGEEQLQAATEQLHRIAVALERLYQHRSQVKLGRVAPPSDDPPLSREEGRLKRLLNTPILVEVLLSYIPLVLDIRSTRISRLRDEVVASYDQQMETLKKVQSRLQKQIRSLWITKRKCQQQADSYEDRMSEFKKRLESLWLDQSQLLQKI